MEKKKHSAKRFKQNNTKIYHPKGLIVHFSTDVKDNGLTVDRYYVGRRTGYYMLRTIREVNGKIASQQWYDMTPVVEVTRDTPLDVEEHRANHVLAAAA